jgi:hypothetical protein
MVDGLGCCCLVSRLAVSAGPVDPWTPLAVSRWPCRKQKWHDLGLDRQLGPCVTGWLSRAAGWADPPAEPAEGARKAFAFHFPPLNIGIG